MDTWSRQGNLAAARRPLFISQPLGPSLAQLLGQLVQAAADFLPVSSGPLALDTRWELINTVSTQLRVTTLRKRNSAHFSSSH